MTKQLVIIVVLYITLISGIFIRFYSTIFEKINVFVVNDVLGLVSFIARDRLLLKN